MRLDDVTHREPCHRAWTIEPGVRWGPIELGRSIDDVRAALTTNDVAFEEGEGDDPPALFLFDGSVVLVFGDRKPPTLEEISIYDSALLVDRGPVIGQPFEHVLTVFGVRWPVEVTWSPEDDDGEVEATRSGVLWVTRLGLGLSTENERVLEIVLRRAGDVPQDTGAVPEYLRTISAPSHTGAPGARQELAVEFPEVFWRGLSLIAGLALLGVIGGLFGAFLGLAGRPADPRGIRLAVEVAVLGVLAAGLWVQVRHAVVLDPSARRVSLRRSFLGLARESPGAALGDAVYCTVEGRPVGRTSNRASAANWSYRPALVDRRGRLLPLGDWREGDPGWREAHAVAGRWAEGLGGTMIPAPVERTLRIRPTGSKPVVTHVAPAPSGQWQWSRTVPAVALAVGGLLVAIAVLLDHGAHPAARPDASPGGRIQVSIPGAEDLARRAEAAPEDLATWTTLGQMYLAKAAFDTADRDSLDRATDAFDHVLALDPRYAEALRGRAVALYRRGKVVEATRDAGAYRALQPDAPDILEGMVRQEAESTRKFRDVAETFRKQGKIQDALMVLRFARGTTTDARTRAEIDEAIAQLGG